MSVGLKTRVREITLDTAQQVAIRVFAFRGEKVAQLITPAGLADPYPIYDELRLEGGISEAKRFGAWLLSSHAIVAAAVRDDRLSVDNRVLAGNVIEPERHFNDHEMILRMDPPDHTRIRRLVGKAFTPRAVAAMRPRIESISDELLDRAGRSFDLVGDYAVPLTVRVICDILGVPDRDWRRFRSWGDDVTRTMGVNVSRADLRIAEGSLDELARFLIEHIREKRKDPGPDLLSAMIAAEEEGDRLNDRELLANTFLILLAGFETTVNLIGNGTAALLGARDQMGEALCGPDADAERRRGAAPLRQPRAVHGAKRPGRRGDRRCGHPEGKAAHAAARCRQQRPGGLRRPSSAGHHPGERSRPRRVLVRSALLPRCLPRPTRG